ncbi:transporter [Roseibium sp. TrichSKD4]|uniref:ACT domain-containing protein n=1 Tax=Roseibium sp. TrichSKD4 TaxID=744980 RepID=UPI0001E5746C|nr:ACT domain-containing protein [Roseibium sp. TrichSKD4]EFO29282.1 transporter [Roseibium sp. TrichSKD4]
MAGETNLQKLISGMRPELDAQPYVFCTFEKTSMADLAAHDPVGLFREAEGLTAILTPKAAEALGQTGLPQFKRITLQIHSALEAVGLTAAFSTALGEAGISANVIAGYYHDHIFIAETDADKAIQVLEDLAAEAGTQ